LAGRAVDYQKEARNFGMVNRESGSSARRLQSTDLDIVPNEASKKFLKYLKVLWMILQQAGPPRDPCRVLGHGFKVLSRRTLQCENTLRVSCDRFVVPSTEFNIADNFFAVDQGYGAHCQFLSVLATQRS
jgi:hypothetical protein